MTLIILLFILTAGLISGNKMIALASYLDEIKHLIPPAAELDLQVMQGGFSNQTYLLSWQGHARCVLRTPGLDKKAFLLQPQAEKKAVNHAIEALLSPPCWYFNGESGVMVSQYVPQNAFDWQVCHQDLNVIRLAKALQTIHQGPSNQIDYCLQHIIETYLANTKTNLQQQNNAFASHLVDQLLIETDWLKNFAQPYLARIPDYVPVMCHNDLNPQNCLADEMHFWVIDWEYAGKGDPLFDIALVFASHNFNSSQKELFFQHYQRPLPSNHREATLENYQLLYKVREMAWVLLKCATAEQAEMLEFYYLCKQELIEFVGSTHSQTL